MQCDLTSNELDLIGAALQFAHNARPNFEDYLRYHGHGDIIGRKSCYIEILRQKINGLHHNALDEEFENATN